MQPVCHTAGVVVVASNVAFCRVALLFTSGHTRTLFKRYSGRDSIQKVTTEHSRMVDETIVNVLAILADRGLHLW